MFVETVTAPQVVSQEEKETCEFCGCVPTGPPQRWQDENDSIHYKIGHMFFEEESGNGDVNIFFPMKCFNPKRGCVK